MTAPREGAFDRWEPTSASTQPSEERWPLPAELAEAVAERDRARSCAVELEQENARLRQPRVTTNGEPVTDWLTLQHLLVIATAERDRLREENARLTAEVTEAKVSAREWERDYRMSRRLLVIAAAERDALRATVAAVRALHQPEACDCENCDGLALRCPQCVGHWPCDTAAALAVPADTPAEATE